MFTYVLIVKFNMQVHVIKPVIQIPKLEIQSTCSDERVFLLQDSSSLEQVGKKSIMYIENNKKV